MDGMDENFYGMNVKFGSKTDMALRKLMVTHRIDKEELVMRVFALVLGLADHDAQILGDPDEIEIEMDFRVVPKDKRDEED